MLKFKKGYNLKLAVVTISIFFLFTNTLYPFPVLRVRDTLRVQVGQDRTYLRMATIVKGYKKGITRRQAVGYIGTLLGWAVISRCTGKDFVAPEREGSQPYFISSAGITYLLPFPEYLTPEEEDIRSRIHSYSGIVIADGEHKLKLGELQVIENFVMNMPRKFFINNVEVIAITIPPFELSRYPGAVYDNDPRTIHLFANLWGLNGGERFITTLIHELGHVLDLVDMGTYIEELRKRYQYVYENAGPSISFNKDEDLAIAFAMYGVDSLGALYEAFHYDPGGYGEQIYMPLVARLVTVAELFAEGDRLATFRITKENGYFKLLSPEYILIKRDKDGFIDEIGPYKGLQRLIEEYIGHLTSPPLNGMLPIVLILEQMGLRSSI